MMGPGWFDRSTALRRLAEDDFDVLVVGGGITGSGCALDAASRGLRTALVERDDFASGTSSKSSKMVHGGLRYLQNGEFRLVYEALHERQRLRTNAPHLVKTLPFLLPVLTGADSPVPRKLARAMGSAMWIYDLTGGARIGKIHERLKPAEALKHFPTLPAERLAAAYLYYDARADDARLTLTLARTASIDHGAVVANGVRLVRVNKDVARPGQRRAGRGRRRRDRRELPGHHQRHGRVGRRRAGARRGHPPRTRSGPPRASTSPSRGARSATTSPRSSRCRRTSGRSSSCRGTTRPIPAATRR